MLNELTLNVNTYSNKGPERLKEDRQAEGSERSVRRAQALVRIWVYKRKDGRCGGVYEAVQGTIGVITRWWGTISEKALSVHLEVPRLGRVRPGLFATQ
jgi:hypothetical protein